MPAASYPRHDGNFLGLSMYLSLRNIDTARLMPMALTSMRTSCGPGDATSVSTNSRTTRPPILANLIARDMIVFLVGSVLSSRNVGGLSGPALDELTSLGKLPLCTG